MPRRDRRDRATSVASKGTPPRTAPDAEDGHEPRDEPARLSRHQSVMARAWSAASVVRTTRKLTGAYEARRARRGRDARGLRRRRPAHARGSRSARPARREEGRRDRRQSDRAPPCPREIGRFVDDHPPAGDSRSYPAHLSRIAGRGEAASVRASRLCASSGRRDGHGRRSWPSADPPTSMVDEPACALDAAGAIAALTAARDRGTSRAPRRGPRAPRSSPSRRPAESAACRSNEGGRRARTRSW
jgi:hypothetical protein